MPGKELRLLALDGGGVRGLSSLMILEQLMQVIDPEHPPKPCEYFDMIGGTSTGGLIAIMLGRLEMTIDECIEAYTSLADKVFQKKAPRMKITGKIRGQFDSKKLEDAIREVVEKRTTQKDTLLKSEADTACKVFVCAFSKHTGTPMCLTSYMPPRGNTDLFKQTKIWEACRATSAATSFFEPISIGRYSEQFVDGGTAVNNPVGELWNQAQAVYGPEPLDDNLDCLVSIGTGVPSLTPVRDDVFHIYESLVAIATETELTAETFRQSKAHLDEQGRYYRFNVSRGLETIGLEESKKKAEIAAATRLYCGSQEVSRQMKACADRASMKQLTSKYHIPFSLRGVPVIEKFADRPLDVAELRQTLLPGRRSSGRQRQICVLSGMGGMGKTQLAAQFARRHHQHYSAVFWLDGTSEDSLKQSIGYSASRVAQGQISEVSRTFLTGQGGDLDLIVEHFRHLLSRPDNNSWLVVLDNVDREYYAQNPQPGSFNVENYLPDADHGAILITTRLSNLKPYATVSKKLQKVDDNLAMAIFCQTYTRKFDKDQARPLLERLDGLPLALTQVAAYMQQTGISFARYIDLYDRRWTDLMQSHETGNGSQLKSIWTTWVISLEAIRAENQAAADLLLLWAFLDNRDLWYGLFERSRKIWTNHTYVNANLQEVCSDEMKFINAIQLLLKYSLIERLEDDSGCIVHPVLHQWARHVQNEEQRIGFARLAVITVGFAVPHGFREDYWTVQRRLMGHADRCFRWVVDDAIKLSRSQEQDRDDRPGYVGPLAVILRCVSFLGDLFVAQTRLGKGSEMYELAFRGYKETMDPEHKWMLTLVNNMGLLYSDQGKLDKAEQMYERALQGREKTLGSEHILTLETVNSLGVLYVRKGKLDKAEEMYDRALRGKEKTLGPGHPSTLLTVNSLGALYVKQGKLDKAEEMFDRASQGKGTALGPGHPSALETVNNLASLYGEQGKLDKAEEMYDRALRGKTLGPGHPLTLDTVNTLGALYLKQGKLDKAEEMFDRASQGKGKALGPEHPSTLMTVNNLGTLYSHQGKLDKAEEMYERALQGFENAVGAESILTYVPALNTCKFLGSLLLDLGRRQEAIEMFHRALTGYQEVYGPSHEQCQEVARWIDEEKQHLQDQEKNETSSDTSKFRKFLRRHRR
ncbi:hypothetical protein EDD36DRAFT_462913 [Exophiala viscosa]|uniref:PNPLA domain-containing protein n=1 Tax=Exophiala viscosa TaxID=2486360 RepID=A0AAN6IHC9_9EURO|nr:hypothetical protein EDD36DRAFT_462913 [Exophiala viscosa]